MISAFINPVNVLLIMFQVKSRMMGETIYKSTLDCFIKTLRNEVYLFSNYIVFSIQLIMFIVVIVYLAIWNWRAQFQYSELLKL